MKRFLISAGVQLVVLPCFLLGADAERAEAAERVAEFKTAALSREEGAGAQQVQARQLVDLASELRGRRYLFAGERKENYLKAGDAEMMAGDLESAAVGNLDKAAQNWLSLAEASRSVGNEEGRRTALISCEDARGKARDGCKRALEAYERAVQDYGPENGADEKKAAAAAERVAALREQVDARR